MDNWQIIPLMVLILIVVLAFSIYVGMKLGVVSITVGNKTYGYNQADVNWSQVNPGGAYTGTLNKT